MAMIQIRGISERDRRRLKARAALEGKSLSEYLRLELEELARLPTLQEIAERVASLEPVAGEPAAKALHAERRRRGG